MQLSRLRSLPRASTNAAIEASQSASASTNAAIEASQSASASTNAAIEASVCNCQHQCSYRGFAICNCQYQCSYRGFAVCNCQRQCSCRGFAVCQCQRQCSYRGFAVCLWPVCPQPWETLRTATTSLNGYVQAGDSLSAEISALSKFCCLLLRLLAPRFRFRRNYSGPGCVYSSGC